MLATTQKRGEIGVALALLGVAAFLILSSVKMPLGDISLPGPGFMPLALGILIAGTAFGLLFTSLKPRKGDPVIVRLGSRQIMVALAGLIWVALLFERLGFFICQGVFLLVLSREFSRRNWIAPLLFAVLGVLAAWWFFVRTLGVTLPRGPL
ncbi:MAG: tripartite tricarboxylate transporter TctB family protein [Thermodesulfobacteriota bacterium]